MQLSLYTDGSSHARGGKPGGWAWVLVNAVGPLKAGSGGLADTTNNVMELTGIREGLRYVLSCVSQLPGEHHLEALKTLDVVSDSQYALGVCSGHFHASRNTDVVSSIQDVAALLKEKGVEIRWTWVRGHDGNTWNERVDRLARAAKLRVMGINRRIEPQTCSSSPRKASEEVKP